VATGSGNVFQIGLREASTKKKSITDSRKSHRRYDQTVSSGRTKSTSTSQISDAGEWTKVANSYG